MPLNSAIFPFLVLATPQSMGVANGIPLYFRAGDYITNLKTYISLFTPGIHAQNHLLDLLLNLPRLLAAVILLTVGVIAWKRRKEREDVSIWFIPFIACVISIFLTMASTGYSFCRQHATIGLGIFGPLFMSMGIVALKDGKKMRMMPMLLLVVIFTAHMIWGIEGVAMITQRGGAKIRDQFKYYEVHKPKKAHFFWDKKRCTFSYKPRNAPQEQRDAKIPYDNDI